jgi:hypothetical protein
MKQVPRSHPFEKSDDIPWSTWLCMVLFITTAVRPHFLHLESLFYLLLFITVLAYINAYIDFLLLLCCLRLRQGKLGKACIENRFRQYSRNAFFNILQ